MNTPSEKRTKTTQDIVIPCSSVVSVTWLDLWINSELKTAQEIDNESEADFGGSTPNPGFECSPAEGDDTEEEEQNDEVDKRLDDIMLRANTMGCPFGVAASNDIKSSMIALLKNKLGAERIKWKKKHLRLRAMIDLQDRATRKKVLQRVRPKMTRLIKAEFAAERTKLKKLLFQLEKQTELAAKLNARFGI